MKKYFSKQHPHGILFSILSRKCDFKHFSYLKTHSCHCERLVCLKNPHTTCHAAFGVLVKTIHFMKSLPSFQNLPLNDRLVLLQNRWVPLFLLGLAQEHITFEVWDFPAVSILRNILLNGQQKSDDCPPTLAEVYKLKMFLNKVWSLDLSLNEYAYLKCAILFSQDIPGLKSLAVTAGLQEEAHRALHMLILSQHHPRDHHTFKDMLFMASTLQMEARSLVTELFFRPITGQTDLQELLNEIIVTNRIM
ncbi:nuclear receptor subfamily 0, group B, member 2b [Ctenopharyngodon idella]|uniref:nuclear receptor subfamily 0, group B, member 2b n=1 Tax=Ctenopharyngodon idella TaxID=7959 RepID=UPI002230C40F|nr:nuclear receptor subfamily 0, group B, member 2b [Ctenopharyngodon idella]